jgi:hypothetical protein
MPLLPQATSTPAYEGASAEACRAGTYRLSGQLHSWKSGDFKLMLKTEEIGAAGKVGGDQESIL